MHKKNTVLYYLVSLLLLITLTACSRLPTPESPRYKPGEAATVVRMQLLHTADMGMLSLIRVKPGPKQPAGWWLLDTGSSHNLIDESLAAQLALTRASSSEISTIGGRKASTHYRLPALWIGKLKLEGQGASTVDLSALSARDSYRVDGVLGMPALANLVLGLDYRNRTVRLANELPQVNEQQMTVPFTLNSGVPVARLQLDGGKRVGNFILDTGNATALVVLPSLRELKRDQPLHFVEVADLGGLIPTQLARLATLTLGARQFRNIPVALPLNSQHAAGVDGSLGNGILARQEVVFDFPRRRLLLHRFGQQSAELAGDFGFLLTPDGYISVVNDHSPAAKAGLRRGDRVVAVAGRDVVDKSAHTIWRLLNQRARVELSVLRAGDLAADAEIIKNKQSLGNSKRLLIRLQRNHYLPLL